MPVVRIDPLAGGAQRAAGGCVSDVSLRAAVPAPAHAPQLRLQVQGGALTDQRTCQQQVCNTMHFNGPQLVHWLKHQASSTMPMAARRLELLLRQMRVVEKQHTVHGGSCCTLHGAGSQTRWLLISAV